MSWEQWFDLLFKLVSLLLGSGLLISAARILLVIGRWGQWMSGVDKEVGAHSGMLQQLTKDVAWIRGRLDGEERPKEFRGGGGR